MTLDEAIKRLEETAIEEDKLASGFTRSHNEEIKPSLARYFEKCAAEHRQFTEWLRDYKQIKYQKPKARWIDGHCSNCGSDVPAYMDDWR